MNSLFSPCEKHRATIGTAQAPLQPMHTLRKLQLFRYVFVLLPATVGQEGLASLNQITSE